MDERERARWLAHERESGYIRVRLRLLTTEEGGRRTPIADGYRSCWGFDGEIHNEMHDAPLLLDGADWLQLGDIATARIHPLWPEGWPTVRPGLRLHMFEGSKLVGEAEVLEVITPL